MQICDVLSRQKNAVWQNNLLVLFDRCYLLNSRQLSFINQVLCIKKLQQTNLANIIS